VLLEYGRSWRKPLCNRGHAGTGRRAYPKATDLLRLAAYGVLENCGYRQLATWWRIVGVVDYLRGKRGWGTMKRKGFATT
jgi:hypothetical protein